MDVLTENIEKDPPWAMMFADELVLCAMTSEEVEEDLEIWRVVFESHGLKISRTKTEYLPSPTHDTETTVKIVDAELPTVTSFKYVGSLFTSEGGSQADVNNRIRIIRWMKWKEESGVMCDRKMPVELKDASNTSQLAQRNPGQPGRHSTGCVPRLAGQESTCWSGDFPPNQKPVTVASGRPCNTYWSAPWWTLPALPKTWQRLTTSPSAVPGIGRAQFDWHTTPGGRTRMMNWKTKSSKQSPDQRWHTVQNVGP